jgi:hypothetical protein
LLNERVVSGGVVALCKYKSMRWLFIFMLFIWFSTALSYYVLHFNLANFLGSPSIIGMIMGSCETVA